VIETERATCDRERASKNKTMSVGDRVAFDAAREESDVHALAAMEYLALFWTELSSSTPSARRLDSFGAQLRRSTASACGAFDELLRLNPTSSSTMHHYAEFISQVSWRLAVAAHTLMATVCRSQSTDSGFFLAQ
jgi:hypothetical protein